MTTELTTETPGAAAPTGTSSRGTRVLGGITVVLAVVLVVYAMWISKPDTELGETVRIMYVHVPTVVMAYLSMISCAVASAVYLRNRSEFADTFAAATAEVGVMLLGLTLVSGMLWGRPTWGVYWTWDARLTSTALLFLMFLGYLTIRRIDAEPAARGTRSAIVALVSAAIIPIVNRSVEWWNGLHQNATVAKLDADLGGTQLFTLFLGFLTFGFLTAWLVMHRFRLGWLEDRAADQELRRALVDRRAEGGGE